MSVWEIVAPINFIDNFWITNCYDQFQLFLNVFWSKWHNGPHKKKNASIISNKFLDKQLFVVLLHILGFLRQVLTITVKILQFRYFALYRMYLFDIMQTDELQSSQKVYSCLLFCMKYQCLWQSSSLIFLLPRTATNRFV